MRPPPAPSPTPSSLPRVQQPHGRRGQVAGDHRGPPALRWAVDAMRAATSRPAGHRGHGRRPTAGCSRRRPGCRRRTSRSWPVGPGARTPWRAGSAPRRRRWSWSMMRPGHSRRPALIDRVAEAAAVHGAAIPVLPVIDSLKQVTDGVVTRHRGPLDAVPGTDAPGRPAGAAARGRRRLRGWAGAVRRRAGAAGPTRGARGHRDRRAGGAQDDRAGATWSGAGARPRPCGDRRSRYAWGDRQPSVRQPRRPAAGGLDIPEAPRLHGHSDGDAALHAVCDGLLAAARLGDLGRLFPAGARATRGIDSRELLRQVVARLVRPACGLPRWT